MQIGLREEFPRLTFWALALSHSLRCMANAGNVSFSSSLRRPINITKSVDQTKSSCLSYDWLSWFFAELPPSVLWQIRLESTFFSFLQRFQPYFNVILCELSP